MNTTFTNALNFGATTIRRASTLALAAALAIGATASTASAQIGGVVRVKIPFAFSVGKTQLPAGEYTVRQLASHSLAIRNDDAAAIFQTTALSNRTNAARTAIVFNRYGDSYFLASVLPAGAAEGYSVPASGDEERLAQAGAIATVVKVEASR